MYDIRDLMAGVQRDGLARRHGEFLGVDEGEGRGLELRIQAHAHAEEHTLSRQPPPPDGTIAWTNSIRTDSPGLSTLLTRILKL